MEADTASHLREDSRVSHLRDENERLRHRVAEVSAALERMNCIQQEVMRLLNTGSPDRIIHDLRNVLNQVVLLEALMEEDDALPR